MHILANRYRGEGLPGEAVCDAPAPSVAAEAVEALLSQCPVAAETPLLDLPEIAGLLNLDSLHVKDERGRMGLGSFKALGAAYVIAHEAAATGAEDLSNALEGRTYVTASAGNHGLSVAAGARVFGARAVIYLSRMVPDSFVARLEAKGAEVRRVTGDYAASMVAAEAAAQQEGLTLLSDSSWAGYMDLPWRLMEGYLAMAAETVRQMPQAPDMIFLQAGVGGMAAAAAAYFREAWGDGPRIFIVEPETAPALIESIKAGKIVDTEGPDSHMGRLDCKTPSAIALKGLSRDADVFCTISEVQGNRGTANLAKHGIETSTSGAAGLVGLLALPMREGRALAILTEGPA